MSISCINGEIKQWKFPAGETGVSFTPCSEPYEFIVLSCDFESNDDIINLLFLVNAIRSSQITVPLHLNMWYFPYARQDRIMNPGESLSLKVICDLINSCKFTSVSVLDPHSNTIENLLDIGTIDVTHQHELLEDFFYYDRNYAIVSPDAGALKKIYKLSSVLECDVIEAGKVRDTKTGKIVKSKIEPFDLSKYATLIIVDDICDGGRTFIELAKVIRDYGFAGKLKLFVTHGIFSAGIEVLKEVFDEVKCVNDMRKGAKNV